MQPIISPHFLVTPAFVGQRMSTLHFRLGVSSFRGTLFADTRIATCFVGPLGARPREWDFSTFIEADKMEVGQPHPRGCWKNCLNWGLVSQSFS
jgi:hypothetical protein